MDQKILVHFRAIGNAPIMKIAKFRVNNNYQVLHLYKFLEKTITSARKTFHLYLKKNKNHYHPRLEEKITHLYTKFAVNNELIINYTTGDKTNTCCSQCQWTDCICESSLISQIDNSLEKYIINLKIISQVKQYDKIIMENGFFCIDNSDTLQPVRRWYFNRNRKNTFTYLYFFIKTIIKTIDNIFRFIDKYREKTNIHIFFNEIKRVTLGLDNLKYSYQHDKEINNKIDNLIQELNTRIFKIDLPSSIVNSTITNETIS